jgi:uridine kinase
MNKKWFNGLIILGAPASGKSTLADAIAKNFNDPIITWIDQFKSDRFSILDYNTDCVIVEELSYTPENFSLMKRLVTSTEIVVNKQHAKPKTISAPVFIFVSNDFRFKHKLSPDDRRFKILVLEN